MKLDFDGRATFVGQGGVDWAGDRPIVVLVHGAGMDRTVWLLHARWFARRGFDVVAPDLPGHGGSAGAPLPDVPAMADWLGDLVGELQARHGLGQGVPIALAGHSMGALVALEAASRTLACRTLMLLGVAYPMAVGEALLGAALRGERAAIDMITIFGHGHATRLGRNPLPGISVQNAAAALLERAPAGTLHSDLAACNAWTGGEAAAARVVAGDARVHVLAGDEDRMTPLRGTRALAELLGTSVTMVPGSGHMLMAERPEAVLQAMRAAIGPGAGVAA